MCPEPVLREYLAENPQLSITLPSNRSSINVGSMGWGDAAARITDWMLAEQMRRDSVRAYFDFLRRARPFFQRVVDTMGYANPLASHMHGDDRWSVGWAGDSMLPIAAHIYCLQSYGVPGSVLECGVYKGSSTACLSWVCAELDLALYAADSFEGLPGAEGYYSKGDFRGSLEEAQDNVARCGRPECVHWIPGWFSESLHNFRPELMLIWMDVDLQQSVVDAMNQIIARLHPNGVILSDGFAPGVDFHQEKARSKGSEAAGFARFFEAAGISHKAVPGGSRGLALIVPNCTEDEKVLFDGVAFRRLLASL